MSSLLTVGGRPLGRTLKSCRMCSGSALVPVLDLGFAPLADRFLTPAQLSEPELTFPLRAVLCEHCGLVQLDYIVDRSLIYQDDYPYESSVTETGRRHFHQMAGEICDALQLPADSLAVDVGSNVGVLLSGFQSRGLRAVGIEPAPNIAEKARQGGIETINDFFSPAVVGQIVARHGCASVLTGTNVFAHIDDLDGFMQGAQELLTPEGILVIEAPYLVDLVDRLEYDTIYHEHLSYLSIQPLTQFFQSRGFDLFDVRRVGMHGGSIRVFASRDGRRKATAAVQSCLNLERETRIHTPERLKRFARDVELHRQKFVGMLWDLRRKGRRLVGISAPAKGNTLLNACKIGREIFEYLTEKSTLKIGRYAPGTHLPIVPDARMIEDRPDYAVILAWNFAEEIRRNLAAFEAAGGRFLLPLPDPRIL